MPEGLARRRALRVAAALAGLLLANATAHETGSPRAGAAPSNRPFLGVIGPAPDFALLDAGGRRVRLADDRDRVVLIAFVYTSCTTACPTLSLRMSWVLRALLARGIDGRRVRFYSITVDPERDSPEVLSRYARSFARDTDAWRFLRESPERLRPVLAAYGEWTRALPDGELDHPARLYLVDGRARIREIYSLAFFNEEQALADIEALLSERP